MEREPDIRKAGGILIKERRLLVERSQGKDFFISPGGSIENNETSKRCLVRELKEEFGVIVLEEDLEEFGTFSARAAGQEGKVLWMDVFVVNSWQGEPMPNSEVEEMLWISSKIPSDIKVGSIFEHEVIPRLKEKGLID